MGSQPQVFTSLPEAVLAQLRARAASDRHFVGDVLQEGLASLDAHKIWATLPKLPPRYLSGGARQYTRMRRDALDKLQRLERESLVTRQGVLAVAAFILLEKH